MPASSAPDFSQDHRDLCAHIVELEKSLQILRARLHSLECAEVIAGLGVWMFDVQTSVGWWSAYMYDLFGVDPLQGIPSSEDYLTLIHPEDRALLAQTMRDLAQGRPPDLHDFRTNPERSPMRILRPNYYIEYDESGHAIRFVGTSLDVTAQHHDQAQLQEQEKRYRLLFETMAQGVIYQAADGTITDANPAAQEILGITFAQLQGRDPFDWKRAVRTDGTDIPIEQHPAMVALHTGQAVLGTVMGIDRSGSHSRRWISINAIPLFEPGMTTPSQVYTTFADITFYKEAEAQLRQSEAQYRYLFEHNPHPMLAYDSESLRFLAVNDAAIVSYGYSRDEFLAMTILDIRPVEDRERLAYLMKQRLPKVYQSNIWCHQRKDGTRINVEITSHAIEIFGHQARLVVAQDVTARVAAETALQQSEARFATIFARSPTALGITRMRDGVIIEVNPAFKELFSIETEIIEQTLLEFDIWVHAEERQYMWDQLRKHQRVSSFETQLRSRTGVEHQVLISGEVVPINDEPHMLIQIMDISALKQAQWELRELNHTLELRVEQRTTEVRELYDILRQANAELLRAARSKDEFLANMSHELRTPINAILGYSESLQEQIYGEISERQRKAISAIEKSGRYLLTLINDILDLSKIEAGRLVLHTDQVWIYDVCQSSLLFVREQAIKKRIHIGLELNDQKALIEADAIRLKQILVNLLSNAVKFTPEGGSVQLEVTVDQEEGIVEFIVHDTGIGIAPTDLGRLFHPFSQIDTSLSRAHEGTGLGLALVRRLTEAHGGSVSVKSELGQGSHFIVALPYNQIGTKTVADSADPITTPFETRIRQSGTAIGVRILLVDDNDTNVNVIREYLFARGYAVSIARDGYEALAMVDKVQPQIFLIDIQMPGLDGLAVIQRLRVLPNYVTTPIIALTALAMPGDKERCLAAGATEYMSKPVSMRTLVRLIQRLVQS